MADMEFRKLTPADLVSVMDMNRDFRSGFICEENARIFLENPHNWLFACVREGRILAFAYGYELNRLNDAGNMLYVHEVGVLPGFQRQGVGTRLLSALTAQCRERGICRFFLFTQKSNAGACALYEKSGGVPAHEDDVSYFFPASRPPS